MAEITGTDDHRSADGSSRTTYQLVHDNGEAVTVDVSRTPTAEAAARDAGNTTALEQMNQPGILAVREVDKLPPPSQGGPDVVRIWFAANHGGDVRIEPM